jgi:hypothetical protein
MGDIIGGLIGGIGSLIGGNSAANAEKAGAAQALTGYNYLNKNPLINQLQTAGGNASTGETGTVGDINSFLTSPTQNNPGFQNFLNSTGYNFNLQQGQDAVTGSAAAKGIDNSGAAAKALTKFGTGLAQTYGQNYLQDLGGLASTQAQQAGQGLSAATATGQAGTTGGSNAGQLTAAAGQSTGTSIANAFNMVGGGVQNSSNNGSMSNFFG